MMRHSHMPETGRLVQPCIDKIAWYLIGNAAVILLTGFTATREAFPSNNIFEYNLVHGTKPSSVSLYFPHYQKILIFRIKSQPVE